MGLGSGPIAFQRMGFTRAHLSRRSQLRSSRIGSSSRVLASHPSRDGVRGSSGRPPRRRGISSMPIPRGCIRPNERAVGGRRSVPFQPPPRTLSDRQGSTAGLRPTVPSRRATRSRGRECCSCSYYARSSRVALHGAAQSFPRTALRLQELDPRDEGLKVLALALSDALRAGPRLVLGADREAERTAEPHEHDARLVSLAGVLEQFIAEPSISTRWEPRSPGSQASFPPLLGRRGREGRRCW